MKPRLRIVEIQRNTSQERMDSVEVLVLFEQTKAANIRERIETNPHYDENFLGTVNNVRVYRDKEPLSREEMYQQIYEREMDFCHMILRKLMNVQERIAKSGVEGEMTMALTTTMLNDIDESVGSTSIGSWHLRPAVVPLFEFIQEHFTSVRIGICTTRDQEVLRVQLEQDEESLKSEKPVVAADGKEVSVSGGSLSEITPFLEPSSIFAMGSLFSGVKLRAPEQIQRMVDLDIYPGTTQLTAENILHRACNGNAGLIEEILQNIENIYEIGLFELNVAVVIEESEDEKFYMPVEELETNLEKAKARFPYFSAEEMMVDMRRVFPEKLFFDNAQELRRYLDTAEGRARFDLYIQEILEGMGGIDDASKRVEFVQDRKFLMEGIARTWGEGHLSPQDVFDILHAHHQDVISTAIHDLEDRKRYGEGPYSHETAVLVINDSPQRFSRQQWGTLFLEKGEVAGFHRLAANFDELDIPDEVMGNIPRDVFYRILKASREIVSENTAMMNAHHRAIDNAFEENMVDSDDVSFAGYADALRRIAAAKRDIDNGRSHAAVAIDNEKLASYFERLFNGECVDEHGQPIDGYTLLHLEEYRDRIFMWHCGREYEEERVISDLAAA